MLPPEWTFKATVTDPSGVRVTVSIAVPTGVLPTFPGEAGEHAQIAANQAAQRVHKYIDSEQEVPF